MRAVHVIGVLEIVVLDVKHQGFESVEVSLFRTVGGFGGTWEGVVGAEAELVVDSDDFVELAPDCEVAEGGEWVHCFSRVSRKRGKKDKEGNLTESMVLADTVVVVVRVDFIVILAKTDPRSVLLTSFLSFC